MEKGLVAGQSEPKLPSSSPGLQAWGNEQQLVWSPVHGASVVSARHCPLKGGSSFGDLKDPGVNAWWNNGVGSCPTG